MDDELREWADGGHRSVRALVNNCGGDVAAFDRDPLTFEQPLDDFVRRLPIREMEEDDWVWLHTQLAAYVAEVLIRNHAGQWERHDDHYVIAVNERKVDPFLLVRSELRPVPQRVPRILQQAMISAGL